jgi:hypothetical protein
MTKDNLKKEINKRLKDDLWDMKIAKSVISKQKSIRSRNIKIISSFAAACFIVTAVYVSLSFKPESNQDFMAKHNNEQVIDQVVDQVIMDDNDIISFSDDFDENGFDIVFSQDVDAIIELAMN